MRRALFSRLRSLDGFVEVYGQHTLNHQTSQPARRCQGKRCYGASGDDIASVLGVAFENFRDEREALT
jgi:hypothetical protein